MTVCVSLPVEDLSWIDLDELRGGLKKLTKEYIAAAPIEFEAAVLPHSIRAGLLPRVLTLIHIPMPEPRLRHKLDLFFPLRMSLAVNGINHCSSG